MKFGFCTGFATCFAKDIDFKMLNDIKSGGYDYVEFPLMQIASLTDDEFIELWDYLKSIELDCDVSCNLFPAKVRVTGPDTNPYLIDEYLSVAFNRCNKLGIKKLIFGSSGARNLPAGTTIAEGYLQLEQLCRKKLIPLLEKYDMTLMIEPIGTDEANFINTLADGAHLAEMVSHERISLLADTIHLLTNGEYAEEIIKYADIIHHIHVSEAGRILPEKGYTKELDSLIESIINISYNETISFETGPYQDPSAIKEALVNLKRRLGHAAD